MMSGIDFIPLINAKPMNFGKLGKIYKKKNPYDPTFAKAQAKRDRKNQLRLERMKKNEDPNQTPIHRVHYF